MNYDVIVIGSGPGGYVGAIRASQLGFKTAVIEKESLGGVCLNWGCIPTKALLKSAQVFEYAKHASNYGIKVDNPTADFNGIIKRSRGVADQMSKGVQFLMKKNKIDVIMGFGKISGKGAIDVTGGDGKTTNYTCKHIIIATGGRARQLPNVPIDGKKVIGYREAMVLADQPKKMLVMGSGAIGVEFANFYNSIGSEVTIVEYMDRIVPVEDKDISRELAKQFKKQGIKIMTGSSVESVDTSGDGVKVTVKTSKGEETHEADVLLSAVGVVSNIENIGLEVVGVKHEKGKVLVDEYGQTNVPGIYAIGDVSPGQALAHVASKEAILTAEYIAYMEKKHDHKPEPIDYGNIPGCTYCSPEVASVGYTEEQAKEAGYEIKVGKFPFMASGKAAASGDTTGFVKVIYDAKYGEWLGTHMIGAGVTDLIAETVLGRKLETTYSEVLNAVHPHPTLSEAVKEATAAAYGEAVDI